MRPLYYPDYVLISFIDAIHNLLIGLVAAAAAASAAYAPMVESAPVKFPPRVRSNFFWVSFRHSGPFELKYP
jgi:hypothetical protein